MSRDSVAVIGGGIAGIQASVDLANMGFHVWVVEKSPSIGGRMAQLDKTFPTNDCSMCILAPKMIECFRHSNVTLLTYSEVESIQGEVGDFTLTVLKKPRYVDISKCTGCGECATVCPVSLPSEFEERIGTRKAIYRPVPQAVPAGFTIDRRGVSPCRNACPAGVRAQGYVALTAQGKFKEALEVVREVLPFPSVCGRACHHPCEDACNRKEVDEPIAIRTVKRFLVDNARNEGEEPRQPLPHIRQERVAVVGSGPAGLTCALRLVERGYSTTVFEAADRPGGMLVSCIPSYRVSVEAAEYDITRILEAGVEVRTGVKIGSDISLDELRSQFAAVFVAIGAQEPTRLPVEGAETVRGVLYGIPFLKEAKAGRAVANLGKRVIVIGGGNVGIDCARSALRLGAREVHLVCLETRDLSHRDRMPAHEWEIEEAEDEGVVIHPRLGPKRVVTADGHVGGLETQVCTSVWDDGRFAPKYAEGGGPLIEGDTLIIAVGQRADMVGLETIQQTPRGTFAADSVTLETSVAGVFAGGDIVSGPASIIAAVAHGNRAAESIDRYLSGRDLKEGREEEQPVAPLPDTPFEREERVRPGIQAVEARVRGFGEVEAGFTPEQAIKEAARCLNCAACSDCRQCATVCEAQAIRYDMKPESVDLKVGAVVVATGFDLYDLSKVPEYGHGRVRNVVGAMAFERLTSASGPTSGELKRPSDGKIPHRLAFIQCVGSRDFRCMPYCSSVCCMHATKEAIMANEHHPETESTIFYMDMRAVGKRFQEYILRAQREYKVSYVRARPSLVDAAPETENPIIHYEDTVGGQRRRMEVDLVVLSQAMVPSRDGAFGVEVDANGFVKIPDTLLHPVDTTRHGIFACGYCQSPRDIPDSVVQGSAAAARVAEVLRG